jgi:hypothetical protein
MTTSLETTFNQDYQIFEKHLKLKGYRKAPLMAIHGAYDGLACMLTATFMN